MDNKTILESVDPEIFQRMVNRRQALITAGKVGIAVSSVPLAFGAMARTAFGQALPQNIIDILNFALTLERLEASFYTMGVAEGTSLIPEATLDVFTEIRDNENAHVAFLEAALGSNAAPAPTFDFTAGGSFDPFNDYAVFLALSQGFEDLGVRAYKGQAPGLMSNDAILTAALQIHSVEARHAGVVRRIRDENAWITGEANTLPAGFAPIYDGEDNVTQGGVDVRTVTSVDMNGITEAFDEPLTMAQVLAIADPFIED